MKLLFGGCVLVFSASLLCLSGDFAVIEMVTLPACQTTQLRSFGFMVCNIWNYMPQIHMTIATKTWNSLTQIKTPRTKFARPIHYLRFKSQEKHTNNFLAYPYTIGNGGYNRPLH